MLTNVSLSRGNFGLRQVLDIIGNGVKTSRIADGMYQCGHWNFGDLIEGKVDEYPDLPADLECLGVCDSPDQWSAVYASIINDASRRFVVSFVEVRRDAQPKDGGWRWHKWGIYIGTQSPRCEYLYDEPEIERVYTFHVYEVLS